MKPKKPQRLEDLSSDARLKMASKPEWPPPRRRRTFRIAAVLLPILFLAAIELVLRLFGAGYPTRYFLRSQVEGREQVIENQQFTRRFFPPGLARSPNPVALPVTKPAGACRIFIFGESAAMGDPEPAYGFGRALEVLLRERFPGNRFEVVNVSITAINSHVVRQIALDCAPREGDIWIVYMGNNEVVGPFGGGTVFSAQVPSLGAIRAQLALKRLRIAQVADDIRWRIARPAEVPSTWEGMEMFLKQQLGASDPRLERVYAHFHTNLLDIIHIGRKAGAKVLVGTVASNVKDCPPFASLHRADLTPPQRQDWDRHYATGAAAEQSTNYAAAQAAFAEAARIDDGHAELVFRQARCALALGKIDEAARLFARARDLDALRFRADTRLNERIRATLARLNDSQCRLVDVEQAVAKRSQNGIPSNELFYEHVHFTFEGNDFVARLFADQIVPLLTESIRRSATNASWVDTAQVAQRLALTDWDRHQILEEMHARLQQPPFTAQFDHEARLQLWSEWLKSLTPGLQPEGLSKAQAIYREALRWSPEDWTLHEHYARLLQDAGDPKGAEQAWRKVIALVPHYPDAYFHLGNVLDAQGRNRDAQLCFQLALRQRPDAVEARNGLGLALANQGELAAARQQYEQALKQNPRFAEARINLGQLLAQQGRADEAMAEYRAALQANSNSAAAHINIGKLLSSQGKLSEAATHYREALRLRPDNPFAHYNLGNVLLQQQDPEALTHFQAAARLKPDFAEAQYNLGLQLVRRDRVPEALTNFAAAVNARPDLVDARFNYAVALAKTGRYLEAAEQFEKVLEQQPSHPQARSFLQKARAMAGQGAPSR